MSDICCAAPSAFSSSLYRLFISSPVPDNKAFTPARSCLLKILLNAFILSASDNPSSSLFKSVNISFISRIFPDESVTLMPRPSNSFAAADVGDVKDIMMFLSFVPPSAPFIPRFARTPNITFKVSKSCPAFFIVAPATSIPSPNCCTSVLDFCEVFAILSIYRSISAISRPKAAIESVTKSDALAKSISPAAASVSTPGSAPIACSVSYPAKAR